MGGTGAQGVFSGGPTRGVSSSRLQQRFFVDFTPHVEESLHKSFKSRNLDRLDSWHLLEMVVDPDWEGKGKSYCRQVLYLVNMVE